MFTYKNEILFIQSPVHPSHTHPFPSPFFTGNHYQEFGLYPSNSFQNHFKNIHTYMYPLLIYSTAFCEASLIQIYKNVIVLDESYCNFISSLKIFEIFLCNTCRPHLFYFTDIQYPIINICHYICDGHLSCFQFMANTNHATVNSPVHYFLSIQTQSRIVRHFSIHYKECLLTPKVITIFSLYLFHIPVFNPHGSYLCI